MLSLIITPRPLAPVVWHILSKTHLDNNCETSVIWLQKRLVLNGAIVKIPLVLKTSSLLQCKRINASALFSFAILALSLFDISTSWLVCTIITWYPHFSNLPFNFNTTSKFICDSKFPVTIPVAPLVTLTFISIASRPIDSRALLP